MAKKRTLDRRTLRDQSDAAEARTKDDKEVKDEVEDEEVEEEEEEADDDGGDDDEEGGAKKKKKPKAKAKAKPKAKKDPAVKKPAVKRTRTPKEVRMKAVWVVFDNSSKRVDTFAFNQKKEAEELLEKKMLEKPNFYMTLVKEPFEA